ncbi:uncharacterized protein BCR38DRAFT_401088 [Pseudomassariella vexata]|uniref:MARVEL domain-containing protein n=1 Tax=Pseudomassariella vexata TaxID=1141098 RepID=A0A1Y2DF56_9PEZI|nr:uncharacterized protein BCR38DRAFT_401088 [Pseudomassariella vexata]ORY57910.1 hypothetical protein BCR38DRAFT_401088 [Pseudomassariella vexata]
MHHKPSLHQRIRQNHTLQKALRALQFLSSIISLGLFSARLYRILKTAQRASHASGAVEGILVAAVAYSLISMIMKFCLKSGGPKILRWVWIVFDFLFVGAFIAVAVLTSPGKNTSGTCHAVNGHRIEPNGSNCNLPWGTFGLAIFSTLLHAFTAAFNEVRDTYKTHKVVDDPEASKTHNGIHHGASGHGGTADSLN